MALSSLTYASRGVGPYPVHGLDYLDSSHLTATVNGVPATIASVDDQKKLLILAAAAAAGATVVIQRVTPRKQEERLTQFLDEDVIDAGLLNTDARQTMLVMQEGRDHLIGSAVPENAMGVNAAVQWEGETLKLRSLASGAASTDAVSKGQLDAAVAATPINLPAVTGADNDDGLMVVTGAWAKKLPSGFRTALSLGGVALLAAGTGASQVPQLDGSARYPTVDGRNIDLTNHALQAELNQRAKATVAYATHTTGQSNNNVDPSASSTWSAAANTRVGGLTTPWTNRVELNNSSDVVGAFAPQAFTMSAGTWRVRWVARVRGPSGVFDPWAFRITDDNDTTGQTILYDSGVLRVLKQPGASNIFAVYSDAAILANASPFKLVFRWASPNVLGNALLLRLFFHKISTSVAT